MRDPIRQLRELPWAEALCCAGLTMLTVVGIEAVLLFGLGQNELVSTILGLVTQGPLAPALMLMWAALVGVLVLTMLERLCPWVRIRTGVLWTLVGSMMIALVVRSLLRSVVPVIFLSADTTSLLSIAIGVFWKGRPYW